MWKETIFSCTIIVYFSYFFDSFLYCFMVCLWTSTEYEEFFCIAKMTNRANGKLFCFIFLHDGFQFLAYSPPQIRLINLCDMKRRGSLYSLIPVLRPSHCLTQRISNARSPRQEILYAHANRGVDTIHLTRTFRCRISFGFSQSCEVWGPKDNVRKRPFWAKDLAYPTALKTQFHRCLNCRLKRMS